MEPDPDGPLVDQARSARPGDLRAFEVLIAKHHKWLRANCRHLTGDANSADDLAQEVFVKIYFGLQTYEGRSSFRRWIQAIKVKHCLNYIKRERKRQFVSFEEESALHTAPLSTAPEVERLINEENDRELVSSVLSEMSETLRIPLILCDMDELSYDEIAGALGISLSATKMRIARARQDFRERYRLLTMRRPAQTAGPGLKAVEEPASIFERSGVSFSRGLPEKAG